jgi:tRNA pseudouridine55 synthase
MKDGIIIVNKPKGLTSHDVVACVRRKLKIKKVGHAGTLDPLATGVLVLLIGRCTKLFDRFLCFDKEYVATLTLGKKTDSGDVFGKVTQEKEFGHIAEDMAQHAFSNYKGQIMQVPPMFSAVKHKGKRLYKLALKGKEVERKPRKIMIHELDILKFCLPDIKFYLKCSKGTYVRQLAEDISEQLQCVGHISQLERQSIGPFHIKESIHIDHVAESHIRPFWA